MKYNTALKTDPDSELPLLAVQNDKSFTQKGLFSTIRESECHLTLKTSKAPPGNCRHNLFISVNASYDASNDPKLGVAFAIA